MTSRAASDLRMFANPDEYELIIIDNVPTNLPHHPMTGAGKHWYLESLRIGVETQYVVNKEDIGYMASMNQGADMAKYDYLCFIENDIILHDNWLRDLRYYLDNNLASMISPVQMPMRREEYLKYQAMSYEEAMIPGTQEQGLVMLRRGTYEAAGKWDNRYKMVYGYPEFTHKIGKRFSTNKVYMSHIAAQTILDSEQRKPEEYFKTKSYEASIKKI
jgi:glycosyltransferase involved in cell wall biosynthesis